MSPDQNRRLHFWLTVTWLLVAVPGVALWRNSVPFLVAVSIYANAAGHWSAHQAAVADQRIKESSR